MIAQLVGMVVIISVIALSIALHEFGHLIPAKIFGVRVPEYAIGFGPTLLSRRIGETTFAWRLIPLGGFIRMIGMYPPARAADRSGRLAQMAEEARAESMQDVLPSDVQRTFYEKSVLQRITIMLGGPAMNFLFAGVLFAVAVVGIGFQSGSNVVSNIAPCWFTQENPQGSVAADGSCVGGESAAKQAGLGHGDVITAVNGHAVSGSQSMRDALGSLASDGKGTLTITAADGTQRTSDVTFQMLSAREYYGDDTLPASETVPLIGVFTKPARAHASITVVPRIMWNMTSASAAALAQFPVKIYDLAHTLATGGTRDPNGPVSVVGITRIGGEIAASDSGFADKMLSILSLAASLNLFLFLFNLLPLLPLDGGHVAGALWEAARDRVRRIRGRTALGPVDTARFLPATYAIAVLLIGVGSLVIVADIVKPIGLGG